MAPLIATAVLIAVWFGIAKQLKKNGRGWLGRNIIAGVGAFFAFMLVVMADIAMSDPMEQLAEKQIATAQASNNDSSEVSRPDEIENAIASLGDFVAEYNEFEVISKNPLHIRLSPISFKLDPKDVIAEQTQRALIYGIYRTFLHTSADQVTVTAQPLRISSFTDRDNAVLLSEPKLTVTKTRASALSDAKSFIAIERLSDVVKQSDGFTPFTKDFNQIYYNDQGGAGLDSFVAKILAGS